MLMIHWVDQLAMNSTLSAKDKCGNYSPYTHPGYVIGLAGTAEGQVKRRYV